MSYHEPIELDCQLTETLGDPFKGTGGLHEALTGESPAGLTGLAAALHGPTVAGVDTTQGGGEEAGGSVAATPAFPPSMIRGLDYAFLQVRGFHQVMGQPAPDEPTLQPFAHAERRSDWIKSECDELTDPEKQTIVDQADAYMDIIYFGLGGLVEIGVLPQSIMDIVNGANMAKVWPDGTVHRRDDGKIIKPPGWVAPEPQLAAEVSRQVAARLLFALAA